MLRWMILGSDAGEESFQGCKPKIQLRGSRQFREIHAKILSPLKEEFTQIHTQLSTLEGQTEPLDIEKLLSSYFEYLI